MLADLLLAVGQVALLICDRSARFCERVYESMMTVRRRLAVVVGWVDDQRQGHVEGLGPRFLFSRFLRKITFFGLQRGGSVLLAL